MNVMPETAAGKYEYQGKTYYFCNPRCLERFRDNPEQFLGKPKVANADSKTESSRAYVCPMDPEVRELGRGVCPKGGMAREPETAPLEEEGNPKLDDMPRRFWIAAVLSAPVL